MDITSRDDTGRSTARSLLPQSRLFWVGIGLSLMFLVVGRVVATGPIAAMLAVWGVTALLISVIGYSVYRLWYTFGV